MRNGIVLDGGGGGGSVVPLNSSTTNTTTNNTIGVGQRRRVTIELLTGETISIPFEGKTTCSAIWNRVEGELVARGVVHPQIFGLAIKSGSDWVFVDPDAKLNKYYQSKDVKSSSSQQQQQQTHHQSIGFINNDGNGSKQPVFYCRVHFYLDVLPQNFDVVSLHHYYLQLRQNLISAPRFPPASVIQSVAYALQSELGDWRIGQEFPRWISTHGQIGNLGGSLTRAYQSLAGLSQEASRLLFIRAVMPQYNMHLFGMRLKTKEGIVAPAWIGVTPKGIEVYQNAVGCNEIPEQPKLTFLWANITKLYFERKKYQICGRAFPWANSTQKLTFTASSETVPQHLLLLCRSTHQFHLSNHKILLTSSEHQSQQHQQQSCHKGSSSGGGGGGGGASSTGGESSCNSTLLSCSSKNDDKMLDLSLWADGFLLKGESSEHQRVSVISNASSNTTSGIVSDRVYSLDGSEEDLELRELTDCCTDRSHNCNSTSLESLSQRHPPPPTRPRHNNNPHLPSSNRAQHNNQSNKCPPSPGEEGGGEDEEAKYWYCDSDCEDCDGPCRSSLLVRTIGEKNTCAVHCECNSCATDDDDDEQEGDNSANRHHHHHHHHHNTPSMASESTLKALDLSDSSPGKVILENGNSVESSDKVQKHDYEGEIEEYKLEDEHVYGEISEDPNPAPPPKPTKGGKRLDKNKNDNNDRDYSTIDGESSSPPRPTPGVKGGKPRYSCIKSIEPQKSGCKCRVKDKCCNPNKKTMGSSSNSSSCNRNLKLNGASNKNGGGHSSISLSAKENNGLTPKVASLKCLRKPKPNCSNVRRNISSRHKGEINFSCSSSSARDEQCAPVNYVEFGEKLQQGRYPSTRTVSDNFDTDSDYVQLPPLSWYPPRPPPPPKKNSVQHQHHPLKIWKCSSKTGSDSPPPPLPPPQKQKESSTSNSIEDEPPAVNINTLPRRKSSELLIDNKNKQGRGKRHIQSRSTTALNLIGHQGVGGDRPEPPPKPRKSLADLSSSGVEEVEGGDSDGNNAVDARFIATKPQILIQTAYATTAPVAIPSQAQVLVRGAKKVMGPQGTGLNNSNQGILQHSQSVDNIYDTVASEEPFQPTITPPPYPTKNLKNNSQKQHIAPLIIRPNNYIDVHASSVKNKLSTSTTTTNTKTSNNGLNNQNIITSNNNHYVPGPGATNGGKNIGNRCGSVPNNLNNFLIGLQNLKPLSRTPIVHPAGATSCLTLNNANNNGSQPCPGITTSSTNVNVGGVGVGAGNNNSRFTTVYTNQLTRSQIQQFKAQLYSDLDYVIFPPKDPRVSQQEYFDSKSLSYTTVSSNSNSNPMLTSAYQMNDIPPPYLPPPPPYPSTAVGTSAALASNSNVPPPLPRKNPKNPPLLSTTTTTIGGMSKMASTPTNVHAPSNTNVTSALSNQSITISSPYHHNSFQSLYHPGSTANSHCSSSQYGYGYYGAPLSSAGAPGLSSENLQRFLSTQSFAGSNSNSTPIYYPSSTQSAPPLPPYKSSGVGGHVIIENGMRKAVQQLMTSRTTPTNGTLSEERLRMKLCRSEESLYSQPTEEEQLTAIYNLPPPPPYKKTSRTNSHLSANFNSRHETFSAAELDLAHLRAQCHVLELPLLRALCSEGELLNKNTSTKALIQAAKNRIRPTAHAHPARLSLPPKPPIQSNPLPIPPKPSSMQMTIPPPHHKTPAS